MQLRGDDRGAAIQVGAIVLFAFVIIAITAYQASVVPSQNEEIEYNHNREVQSQLQEFQSAVWAAPSGAGSRTTVVQTSTSYPARTIFVNPPRPTGRLQTVGTTNDSVAFEIANATSAGETGDFWNGDPRNYSTGALAYYPNYNVYGQAPRTVVSNSLVTNHFSDQVLVANPQSIFDGKRVTLVALNGSYREEGGAASVTVRPVSASTNRVPVKNETGENVTVTVVSQLSASQWTEQLVEAGEYDPGDNDPDAYVKDVRRVSTENVGNGLTAHRVTFVLEQGTTYSLGLAKVGVGSGVTRTEGGTYVTTSSPKNASTTAGSSETLTVEVRDEYNNPESDVDVSATVESGDGSIAEPNPATTGADGRASFTYDAPDSKTEATVNVTLSGGGNATNYATFNVSVSEPSGGGGGGGNGAYDVTLVNPETTNAGGVTCSNWPADRTCEVDGSMTTTVDVTMDTDPTASRANVSWAVNDTTIATDLDPEAGRTGSNGRNTTTVTLDANGDVIVYVSSGAGGNRTTLQVSGVPEGPQPGMVYTTTGGYLRSIDSQGRVFEFGPSGQVSAQAFGPMNADIDGDGKLEVPYLDGSGALKIRDMDGEAQTLVPASFSGVKANRMAVGSYRTGDPEVYFAGSSGYLYRVDWEGGSSTGPQGIYRDPSRTNDRIQAQSVAGVGDFDGADGDTELVYVDGGSKLTYLNEKSNGRNERRTAVNSRNVVGAGATSELGGLDGDSRADVAWRTGNEPHVRLADSDGRDSQLPGMSDKPKSGASMGLYDVDGDSELELVYVDQGQFLKYYDFASGSTAFVRDEDGNRVKVAVGPGVA